MITTSAAFLVVSLLALGSLVRARVEGEASMSWQAHPAELLMPPQPQYGRKLSTLRVRYRYRLEGQARTGTAVWSDGTVGTREEVMSAMRVIADGQLTVYVKPGHPDRSALVRGVRPSRANADMIFGPVALISTLMMSYLLFAGLADLNAVKRRQVNGSG